MIIDGISGEARKNVEGQLDLFSGGETAAPVTVKIPELSEFSAQDLMAMEKETTGLYLSGHPMDEHREAVRRAGAVAIGSITADFAQEDGPTAYTDGQLVTVAGVIESSKTKTTKNGSLMSYIQLEDTTGTIETIAFQRVLDVSGGYIKEGAPVVVMGKISARDEKEPQLMLETLRPIEDASPPPKETGAPAPDGRKLWIRLPTRDEAALERLRKLLFMFEGGSRVIIYIEDENKRLAGSCWVHPALLRELQDWLGGENVVFR
jgi:DNA polymerase-3 subunit alpha